ncbi:hypothetical protein Taro_020681 [Colocasia esculenta]|uniref:Terpene synthase metal-binding domain-containing protein n=1 Tax=Colocasia esculenta TaxID=4460 RepID=A0A843UWZ3_COLES|nr:hypothetical protein [Colocasia esculenta]
MENYFCSIAIALDPQFSRCREKLTQVCCLISTIDDIYDEYRTYDELYVFTNAVERREVTAAYDLPQYMQSCYLVLLNTVGQMCHELQREKGLGALPFLKVGREGWDTPSAIACYMNENSATEEAARRHIKDLIDETWSAMSQEITASSLPARFTAAAANVADRLGHCLYQHGDGHSKLEMDTLCV